MTPSMIDAAIWTDAENRTWSTAISVNAIRRVKELVGVNLLEVFDGEMLARLADDRRERGRSPNVTYQDIVGLLEGSGNEHASGSLLEVIYSEAKGSNAAVLKGPACKGTDIPGAELVESWGGEVIVPEWPIQNSTTQIVERL